ncbi:MAG: alpha/beta fold hydrolase [Alphaproteobacteria bacterium]|nr:alpha/beta fold hydrolase [Alphaproteobacteria bacterium]
MTLILLPGLLCDAALWREQIAHFASKVQTDTARPVAVQFADLTLDDSIAAMAARVLSWAPNRFSLAGLSMGGYVAQEILRQAPQRVERLALLDTSARPDSPDQTARRRGLIDLARRGRFRGVTPRLLPLLLSAHRLQDAALTGAVMAMAERVGSEAYLRQQTAILNRIDSRPSLPAITCPTLVICGREDALTPLDHSEELAASIPAARLAVIDGCGHLSTMETPEEVNTLLDQWLGGTS